jgi:hypothetical protein
MKGETFFEAATRKIEKEISGIQISPKHLLGVYNTFFEESAWAGATQTVNILIHATTNTSAAVLDNLAICGDRKGKCPDGYFGNYKWVDPAKEDSTQDKYIAEGLAQMQLDANHAGMLLQALRRKGFDVVKHHLRGGEKFELHKPRRRKLGANKLR